MFATSPHAALSHGDFIIPDTWPYQTVAQSKTLCHGCESEVQKGSPGERSLTSGLHTDSFRLSFSKLQPRKAPNCLLLNWKKKKKKKILAVMKLRACAMLEKYTYESCLLGTCMCQFLLHFFRNPEIISDLHPLFLSTFLTSARTFFSLHPIPSPLPLLRPSSQPDPLLLE